MVELGAADLEVVTQARVGCVQCIPERLEIVVAHRAVRLSDPLVLGHDVPRPAVQRVLDVALQGLELLERHVAQCSDAGQGFGQPRGRLLALAAPQVVIAVAELAVDAAVDDEERRVGRQQVGLAVERAAVEHDRVVARAGRDDELVHNAAGNADEVLLRLLAHLREARPVDLVPRARQHREPGGDFEGRGRAQAAAQRHLAGHEQVSARQREPFLLQHVQHPLGVFLPALVRVALQVVQAHLDQVVEVERVHAHDPVVARRDREPGV